jgi:hypothetical protein
MRAVQKYRSHSTAGSGRVENRIRLRFHSFSTIVPTDKTTTMQPVSDASSAIKDIEGESFTSTHALETGQNVATKGSSKVPESARSTNPENEEASARYIPEHKKHDAALTFPEKVRRKKSKLSTNSHSYWLLYLIFYLHLVGLSSCSHAP